MCIVVTGDIVPCSGCVIEQFAELQLTIGPVTLATYISSQLGATRLRLKSYVFTVCDPVQVCNFKLTGWAFWMTAWGRLVAAMLACTTLSVAVASSDLSLISHDCHIRSTRPILYIGCKSVYIDVEYMPSVPLYI